MSKSETRACATSLDQPTVGPTAVFLHDNTNEVCGISGHTWPEDIAEATASTNFSSAVAERFTSCADTAVAMAAAAALNFDDYTKEPAVRWREGCARTALWYRVMEKCVSSIAHIL